MTDQEMSQPADQPLPQLPAAQPAAPAVNVPGPTPSQPRPPSTAAQPAAPAADGTVSASPAASSLKSAGRQYAPPLGTRIEVLWRIESPGDDDMEGEVVDRWWGAVVQDCTAERVGSVVKAEWAGELVHMLLYDAYGEFGEDTARVAFVPNGSLVDLARLDDEIGGVLDWRKEGEEPLGENVEMSLEEFANEQDMIVQEAGLSKDADLHVLSQYPANVQINVASGYRIFADGVKEMLGELVATKPAGYVVTEADVQSIFQKIQAMKENNGQVNTVGM